MATEAVINTFSGGMDMDTDVSVLQPNKYRKAVNLRLTTTASGTSYALETVLGTETVTMTLSGITGSIFSYCWMRDLLIVFTTDNKIYELTFNSAFTQVSNIRLIYSNSALAFSQFNPIKAIARYENEDTQKIFWTDGVNPVRFANIAPSNTSLATATIDALEFLPRSLTGSGLVKHSIKVNTVVGGFYTTGRLQYAIQYVSATGTESPIYLDPTFYHIAKGSDGNSSDKGYFGGATNEQLNKGFNVTVSYIPYFVSKVRLIAVKYNEYNAEPTIDIVAENKVPGDQTLYNLTFTDLGSTSLGTYTPEELSILATSLFTAQDIETKNDILFAGNISNSTWDVTYDARAYRYAGADNTDASRRGKFGIWKTDGSWDLVSSTYLIGGSPIPETHDCINAYNDRNYEIDGTYETRFRYQKNTTTLGGEGPNVRYKFNLKAIQIADSGLSQIASYTNTKEGPASAVNNKYTAGYQRGEIYRFGIVFHNNRGQDSSVKWIGDIRFPDYNDTYTGDPVYAGSVNITPTNHPISIKLGAITYSYVLVPYFTVLNIPSDAVGFTIVRANRDAVNRTIICNGVVGGTLYSSSLNLYYPPPKISDNYDLRNSKFYYDTTTTHAVSYDSNPLSLKVLEFISPEVNINKNIAFGNSSSDKLLMSGLVDHYYSHSASDITTEKYTSYSYVPLGGGYNPPDPYMVTFYYSSNYAASLIRPYYHTINDFKIVGKPSVTTVETLNSTGSVVINNKQYKNSIHAGNQGYHGTVGILDLADNINFFNDSALGILYTSYLRINNSIYNGPGYSSRLLTEYYACTPLVSSTPAGNTVEVYSGDIYISMYEYMRSYFDLNYSASMLSHVYFPVESTINLSLRSDKSYRHSLGEKYACFMQETAGVHTPSWASDKSYAQTTDMYVYNPVYSQQNKSKVYFQKDLTVPDVVNFDYRVLYSDTKINGESVDSWTKFRSTNYKDVDSTYGSLNALSNYNNQLYFWQTNAFGTLSVNQRELIPSSTSVSPLVLGTGGILDRYDYVSYEIGTVDNINIIKNNFGMYWFDFNRKVLVKYGNTLDLLSKSKLVHSYFNDTTSYPVIGYDPLFNEIIIGKTSADGVLVYSELLGLFTRFDNYFPSLYLNNSKVLLSKASNSNQLYVHRSKGSPGMFYTSSTPYASLSFSVNDKYPITKVFDNIEFESEATNINANDIDRTFTELRCYDSYQNTGFTTLTYNTNLRRKSRTFTLAIPRNAVAVPVNTPIDILSASNLDTTRKFKDRMRDKYLNIDLVYNGNSASYKLRIPYILTKYRISDR